MVALTIWTSIGMLWRTLLSVYPIMQSCDNSLNNAGKKVVAVFLFFWNVDESGFFCNKMSTNRAFICNKISSKYLCRFVDIDELRCLRIGTNAVSIRRHRRIGLSTNRDKCGVDSSTSTNRDVYQCGYLRIDLLPFNWWRCFHSKAKCCVFMYIGARQGCYRQGRSDRRGAYSFKWYRFPAIRCSYGMVWAKGWGNLYSLALFSPFLPIRLTRYIFKVTPHKLCTQHRAIHLLYSSAPHDVRPVQLCTWRRTWYLFAW